VNLAALVAVPVDVLTLIGPVTAPLGTVALTDPPVLTENTAATPPTLTAMAPPRSFPLIVSLVPTGPLPGENPVTLGSTTAVTVNGPPLAVPPAVVTVTTPVIAEDGTVAVIDVSDPTVYAVAGTVPNFTPLAAVNPLPVRVTVVPGGPLPGATVAITGGAGPVGAVT